MAIKEEIHALKKLLDSIKTTRWAQQWAARRDFAGADVDTMGSYPINIGPRPDWRETRAWLSFLRYVAPVTRKDGGV